MKLEDLDLSRCLYNPNKSSFLNDMDRVTGLTKELNQRTSRRAIWTYIVLLYDESSPLRREVRSLPARKGVAAQLAGIKTDKNGRFEPHVERMIEGKNQDVNAMIVKYLVLQNSPKFVQLCAYESLYYFEIAKIQNGAYGKTTEVIKSIDSLATSIDRLTEEIIGGKIVEESSLILAAIYQEVTKELNISPEAISNYIMESGDVPDDFNPYKELAKDGSIKSEYKPEKIKFVGDE